MLHSVHTVITAKFIGSVVRDGCSLRLKRFGVRNYIYIYRYIYRYIYI